MTFTVWQFLNLTLGIFGLGVLLGITATLVGLTVSNTWMRKKRGNKDV